MTRLLMTAFGGLLIGLSVWGLVGFIAAEAFSKSGHQDGGGAMGGFFFVGGAAGLLGTIIGAVVLWQLLANPARTGVVGGSLAGLLLVFIIAVTWAMQPTYVERSSFPPGMRGEFHLETSFPTARIQALSKHDSLSFQLRSGDGEIVAPWQRDKLRQEGDRTIVPATFKVKEVRQWVLGIMEGDTQLEATDAGRDGLNAILEQSTEWSDWMPTASGLQVRWRFVVLPR